MKCSRYTCSGNPFGVGYIVNIIFNKCRCLDVFSYKLFRCIFAVHLLIYMVLTECVDVNCEVRNDAELN